MKGLLLFSLCVICVETKLESGFAGASGPSVHSFFAADTRHKRQVRDPRQGTCSMDEFSRRQSAILCDPSNDGNGQQLVDIYNECRYDANIASAVRSLVQSCSRDENGRFCYQLGQNASNYTYSVTTNCPRLSNYSEYQCTNSCRDALQNSKSNLGCCLNDLYNTTLPSSNFLNTGLWSACGVNRPDFCSDSTLTQGSMATSGNCSNFNDAIERIYGQFYCIAEVFHPYLDVYQQCGYHDQYDSLINLCRVTANNELCGVVSSSPNATSYLVAINSHCLQLNLTQGCTNSCQTALNNLKSTIGCCVNLYSTFFATNLSLWAACGIPFPSAELCPSTLLSTNQSRGTAASSSVTTTLATSSYNSATTLHFPNNILLLMFSALFTRLLQQ